MGMYVSVIKEGLPRSAELCFRYVSPFWRKCSGHSGEEGETVIDEPNLNVSSYEKLLSYAEKHGIYEFEIAFEGEESLFLNVARSLSLVLVSKDISIGLLLKNNTFINNNLEMLDSMGITVPHSGIDKAKPSNTSALFSFERFHRAKRPERDIKANQYGLSFISANACFETFDEESSKPVLEKSFHERLLEALVESNLPNAEVYRRAGISRQVFSNILSNPDLIPTKPTVICLILGLRLSLKEGLLLLESAGYTLSPSLRSDVIVRKYIMRGIYDLMTINSELDEYGCPLLRWHSR